MTTNLCMGLILSDINAASRAIDSFSMSKVKYDKNVAAYHIQQAVEKLIKIQVYYYSNGSYVNSGMYTHNIDKLILFCKNYGIPCYIPSYIVQNSVSISEWEVIGRYDLHFSVNVKSLSKSLSVTIDWFNKLKRAGYR